MAKISPQVRSHIMRSIRKTDTRPEIAVRRMIRELGIGYRLHAKELPGRPDIVFRRRRKAIFVHGCFWHQHGGCRLSKRPSARPEYWLPKLERNRKRDQEALEALASLGWEVLVVWECELADECRLKHKVTELPQRTRRARARRGTIALAGSRLLHKGEGGHALRPPDIRTLASAKQPRYGQSALNNT
jgi:DNA mismatch endonuclease (patch repair protein)